ncbi:phage tail protein, partial [Serratia proteamaculans]
MSQTVITAAFEQWKAQEAAGGKPVVLDGFVLANVPGLDPSKPVSNTEGMPPAAQIVYRHDVDKVGVVNNNAVVYSITMGSNVGTFDFNWIGLVNKASGTVAMIVHAPMQRKLKTEDGQQGNAINRSFLMEYDGAATETQINTPAQTWQIDFTARLAGMDEELRLGNVDIYGAGAFFGDGYLVTKTGTQYAVSAGSGYVGGIRTTLASAQNITVTTKPVKVWLDVTWQGTLSGRWHAITTISVSASELKDHTDANGFAHYVFAVASIDGSGEIIDLRPKGSLVNQSSVRSVNNHGPDASGDVKLGTAADADIGTSTGNAIGVGGFGLASSLTAQPDVDLNDLKNFGFYIVRNASNAPINDVGVLYVSVQSWNSGSGGDANRAVQTVYSYTNKNRAFCRTYFGPSSGWSGWVEFFSEAHKPTAADINA